MIKNNLFAIAITAFLMATVILAVDKDAPNKTFSIEELAKYNGKDGNPAYVAIDSVVYDLSNVPSWSGGKHKMGAKAGKDLSKLITKSPHGKAVLTKLPKVGTLN